jgi:hypothetical protein
MWARLAEHAHLVAIDLPGFAVGDVRSGSVKRAATAIGEGSMAVRLVFERLQATGSAVTDPPRADTDGRNTAVPTGKQHDRETGTQVRSG